MRWKRLFYYVLLNVIVSACTTLVVLVIWSRANQASEGVVNPLKWISPAVTALSSSAGEPPLQPGQSLQVYLVGAGDTLVGIANAFGTTESALMAINRLSDPDSIREGMMLYVPVPVEPSQAASGQTPALTPMPVGEEPPVAEQPLVEIVTVIAAGDLESEHVRVRSVSDAPVALAGWRLEDQDGQVYFFPQITLSKGGAVELYSRAGVDNVVALYLGRTGPLCRSGETITILDAAGVIQATFTIP